MGHNTFLKYPWTFSPIRPYTHSHFEDTLYRSREHNLKLEQKLKIKRYLTMNENHICSIHEKIYLKMQLKNSCSKLSNRSLLQNHQFIYLMHYIIH